MTGRKKSLEPTARANRTIYLRIVIIAVLFGFLVFIPLYVQLFNIQITNHDYYEQKAVEQQTRDTELSAARGVIYDRNMTVLAISAGVETIFISPADIKTEQQAQMIAQGLSDILDVDYETVYNKTQNTSSYYEVIQRKVDNEVADEVRAFIIKNNIKGIHLEEDTKRYYPYGSFASHLIGFVRTDNVGAEGIEAYYESDLEGTPGRIISAKDASGTDMPFSYEKYYDAQDGLSLELTIDETIQHYVEKQLEDAVAQYEVTEGASCIVMDVNTGEILAMAVNPSYDLNSPWTITDEEAKAQIDSLMGEDKSELLVQTQLKMWRNTPIVDTYEPGSTFKIITASIALEENIVSLNDTFTCTGSTRVPGWPHPISCWKTAGHGTQTFAEAIQNSCNVAFIEIGQRIGSKLFYQYMQSFGFMDKTGIDLPGETTGIIHDYSTFSQSLVPVSVYAFGQTFKITPIQLITAVSAVANGGYLMEPHFVKAVLDSEGTVVKSVEPTAVRQVISEQTSQTMCELLESVVSEGTGSNAYVRGYRIGGKTGTGEKRDLYPVEDRDGNYVVSFMGIAPMDDPQIAVLVVLNHPVYGYKSQRTGGQMAAPVAGRIFADILPYMGIEPSYTAEELTGADVSMPNLTGMTQSEAEAALNERGLSCRTVGSGETVTDQVPAANAKIPNTSEVVIYLGEQKPDALITVPDLSGLSPEQANSMLTNLGLFMRASGAISVRSSGVVAATQSIEAGVQVGAGTVIDVEFLDTTALVR